MAEIEIRPLADHAMPHVLDCYRTATAGRADMMPPYLESKIVREPGGHIWGIHAFDVDAENGVVVCVTDPNRAGARAFFSDDDGNPIQPD